VSKRNGRTITDEQSWYFGSKLALTSQGRDETGYPGMERDRMMEYPGVARHRTGGTPSLEPDERLEGAEPSGGPQGWPEWKFEDDQAYQQYLDEVFRGDVC
jgi:hypothetical protein